MSILFGAPEYTAEIDGDDFTASEADLQLDATAVPYAAGSLTFPMFDESILDVIDAPGDVRIPVTAGGRLFDLSLRRRTVDHAAKTTTLALASDEAILQTYAPITDDTGPRAHEASLRAVCNYVLNAVIPGAALEAGGPDANVTAYWSARNLIVNPRITALSPDYSVVSASMILDGTYPGAQDGIAHNGIHLFTGTGTDSYAAINGGPGGMRLGMRAGGSYVFSAYYRVAQVSSGGAHANARRLTVHALSPRAGGYVQYASAAAPNVVGATGRLSVAFTLPDDATEAFVRLYLGDTGAGGGRMTYGTPRLVERGPGTVADDAVYFWGSKPAAGGYTYAWEGVADNSASSRTPAEERLPDVLTWRAGQTAWDFLMTLAASVGMVLWCDELRRWYLQAADARTLPTLISVSPTTSRDGTDTIDRDNPDTATTGVVCRYRWSDANGVTQQQNDSAGTPGNVLVVDFPDTPYRPGVAAAMLARREGTTRTQDVTCITNWSTTPGMTASISLPGAPDTYGRIAGVQFYPDGFMTLTMAGLIDIVPGSIAALVGTIDSLVGTIDSL